MRWTYSNSTARICAKAPLEARRARSAKLLGPVKRGLRLSDQVEADGSTVYRLACELGAEGIISKLKGSRYRSGRTRDWLKMKNPHSPAAKREFDRTGVGDFALLGNRRSKPTLRIGVNGG